MAGLNDIQIHMRLRPCLVGCGEDRPGEKALLHRWVDRAYVIEPSMLVGGHPGGQVWNVHGLVELEDGSVVEVPPCNIKFLDPQHEGFVWPPTEDM